MHPCHKGGIPPYMTAPNKIPEDDSSDPFLRPASPGEASDSVKALQKESWRERYPGWETFEGRPHDPRFMSSTDPNEDPRYNTDLKNSMVLPRRAGLATWAWFIFLGIILMTLLGFAMYIHFQKPSPRSPDQTGVRRQLPIHYVNTRVADSLLPLRVRHRDPR